MLESLTTWLIATDDAGKLWTIVAPLVRHLRKRRRWQVIYAGGGLEFFATRQLLDREHSLLARRLAQADVQTYRRHGQLAKNFTIKDRNCIA